MALQRESGIFLLFFFKVILWLCIVQEEKHGGVAGADAMEQVKKLDAKLKKAHAGLRDHLALEKKVRKCRCR